jgi:L-ascorbate metabolism protein UlaG (beta-lactamase superfamily)
VLRFVPETRVDVIKPVLGGDAFLADIARGGSSIDELRMWWLGQSGFLAHGAGSFFLLDPYLSDSLTGKYAQTDKPHVRMTERVIEPERLHRVAFVASSHNHTDHFDPDTLLAVRRANPKMRLIVPEANRLIAAQRLGIDPMELIGLDEGTSVIIDGIEIQGIAAAHNDLAPDEAGHHCCLGYIIRCGTWTVYHAGDTLCYPGLVEKLRRFPIDVALLPINGNKLERRVAGNLDGREAAQLAHDIGARCVIPCHYEMFTFNTADPAELFIPECQRLGQRYRVLRVGEAWSSSEFN